MSKNEKDAEEFIAGYFNKEKSYTKRHLKECFLSGRDYTVPNEVYVKLKTDLDINQPRYKIFLDL